MNAFIDWLEQRLTKPLPGLDAQIKMVPPASLKLRFKPIENPVKSSVLMLLYPQNGDLHTVFIKRPEYNGPHSGQISLPGGKMEPEDPDLKMTALREAEEEIGIIQNDVRILGKLTEVQIPVSGFVVEPYIGFISYRPNFVPEIKEVSRIIETDINFFTKNDNTGIFVFRRDEFKINAPYFKLKGEKLWGATAMMMSEFREILQEYC